MNKYKSNMILQQQKSKEQSLVGFLNMYSDKPAWVIFPPYSAERAPELQDKRKFYVRCL